MINEQIFGLFASSYSVARAEGIGVRRFQFGYRNIEINEETGSYRIGHGILTDRHVSSGYLTNDNYRQVMGIFENEACNYDFVA